MSHSLRLLWIAIVPLALTACASTKKEPEAPPAKMPLLGLWTLSILFLQFMFGAYVAGLEAGEYFETWPLMGSEFYPHGYEWLQPALRNFVDNPITVLFVHRWLAFLVAALALWLAWRSFRKRLWLEAAMVVGAVLIQILLGILTVLSGVQLDIAVAHQGMAVLLLGAVIAASHRLGERRE